MRIIFAGTPDFATHVLQRIISSNHEIVGVFCQPDRPKGRGKVLTPCSVKIEAEAHNLEIFQPLSLKDGDIQAEIKNLQADVMVVVAYGQILPKTVLDIPKYGCLNIHASLLPRWRGAAPIQRAILAGDKTTGVGIMQMDEGLDTGDVLLEKSLNISDNDTAQTLHDKLANLGADAINEALNNLATLKPTPQSSDGITYAQKLSKGEAWIDWSESAVKINQQIRAFNPYPIAQTHATSNKFESKVLRILSANPIGKTYNQKPGEVIDCTKGVCLIATGDGALSLETVQLAGKKAISIKDFNNAYQLTRLE